MSQLEVALTPGGFEGLRLTADQYFDLPDDGARYELIDGVVVMSPSPTPRHQHVCAAIFRQLANYVEQRQLGTVLYEVDVQLPPCRVGGRQIVYRPEVVYISAARREIIGQRIVGAPDLVVEVISPDSRARDEQTKRRDYELAGVGEFWLIDPLNERLTFLRLADGLYVEAPQGKEHYACEIVPGLLLNLEPIRAAFRAFS